MTQPESANVGFMGGQLDCERRLGRRPRLISLAECVAGTLFVLGHNVWRVLPNEVYLLVVVGLVSLWLRNGGMAGAGLRRPGSWAWTVVAAMLLGGVYLLTGNLWAPILAHGLTDTYAVAASYFGWA
jgi:membrane protease YdiL (CAAX protease family)